MRSRITSAPATWTDELFNTLYQSKNFESAVVSIPNYFINAFTEINGMFSQKTSKAKSFSVTHNDGSAFCLAKEDLLKQICSRKC